MYTQCIQACIMNAMYRYLRRTCSISRTREVKYSGLLNMYACCSIDIFRSSSARRTYMWIISLQSRSQTLSMNHTEGLGMRLSLLDTECCIQK